MGAKSRNGPDPETDGASVQRSAMGACDAAQAALFAELLADEVIALRDELREAEYRWNQRLRRSRYEPDTPTRLIRLREQLEEAETLSASLRKTAARNGQRPILTIVSP